MVVCFQLGAEPYYKANVNAEIRLYRSVGSCIPQMNGRLGLFRWQDDQFCLRLYRPEMRMQVTSSLSLFFRFFTGGGVFPVSQRLFRSAQGFQRHLIPHLASACIFPVAKSSLHNSFGILTSGVIELFSVPTLK